MASKPKIDWDAVERDYRAGVKTLREMAALHNVSHVSIDKHAKKHGWTRDLTAKIKAKADELVNKALANKEANKLTEIDIVKSIAELQAGALLQESAEIKNLSEIAAGFEEELKLLPEDANGIPLDLEKRTRILKSLAEVREKIINLRRRNMGINDNANGEANKTPVQEVRYTVIDSTCTRINDSQ